MSFVSANPSNETVQKFLEVLQNDFRTLANETKKKYPQIKESCEEAILKLKATSSAPPNQLYYVVNQILYALVQGCESKDVKIIKYCLGIMQRLITQQVVDQKGARYITDALWMLMEHSTEEVKVLQTVTLLLTTNSIVHGETLAKALVLCFRLHFTKDSTTINTASATVRQLVSLVFERVIGEDQEVDTDVADTAQTQSSAPLAAPPPPEPSIEELKQAPTQTPAQPPKGLQVCAADAYLLFQDLVQLVNADQPYWLLGMTEMTRTFGLELLEAVLTQFPTVFHRHQEFSFLLKERVCALVIKLFSPNIKYRTVVQANPQQPIPHDKPYFPISMRLLRVVSILIQKYHRLLITECEIFLSLIVKFLDPDKPAWQRSLALEVIHKMCVQPELLVAFCQFYDLKDHATNIFQDIINSLGAFVQSLFAQSHTSSSMNAQPMPMGGSMPMSGGPSQQAGFLFRGVWYPLIVTFPTGQSKSTYLDMLDKVEPPAIPDGFGISIAYACLLDIVRSISLAILGPSKVTVDELGEEKPPAYKDVTSETDKQLHCQIVNSSWCGLLAALTPLIDAATDESITENVLKALQNYAALCGTLDIQTPRDAFITSICRSSLPPHYALSVLNMGFQFSGILTHSRSPSQDLNHQYMGSAACGDNDFRHQVVAVGTPLPTSSLPIGAQQGPVMLTTKNLQCMRAMLHLAHCHGCILGTSWHIVLTTLQHSVWILGLKPSTGGSLQVVPKPQDTTVGLTTSVMADLPVLSQMLSQLFESSQYLDDVALHHLIDALCKLSQEAMELAYSNREPSLFAVAKLLETGLVNLPRIEVLWRPLTNHLLEVCQHPHIRMREWGVEAITYLVKAALQHKYETPLKDNSTLQTLLLNPLAELSSVPHGDVRQRQLECVLQILNGTGELLTHGWPLILGIIGAVNDRHGETLIRIAFQCLQLVVTDFLPVMPWRCLPLCVNTAAKFGSQNEELNISLTAVGLMWNISDYFNQNQDKLSQSVADDATILPDFPGTMNVSHFDKLWMCLFARLADLCVDARPAVRKSAGQTLFSTISVHGSLLNCPTWQPVLWQVLFPLLDKVRSISSSASSEKVDTTGNILIHHSRNTAQKQWAETYVLTLSGVARVFNTKRHTLRSLGDFSRAWTLLLEFIENAALSKSNEVSLAALKSFQEILYNKPSSERDDDDATLAETQLAMQDIELSAAGDCDETWNIAWRVWLSIGGECTKSLTANHHATDKNDLDIFIPSQPFLTALIQIFPALFKHISHTFNEDHLKQLTEVLTNTVAVPVHSDSTPYIMSSISDSLLTPLHDGVLLCMDILCKRILTPQSSMKPMISIIFNHLLNFSIFACVPPTFERLETRPYKTGRPPPQTHTSTIEWVSMNYIPFGEKAMNRAISIYLDHADDPIVVDQKILLDIINTLKVPLAMKYKCMAASTWKLAITNLLAALHVGLDLARRRPESFGEVWPALSDTLDQFLFPATACTIEDRGIDEIVLDEAIDCQIIEMIRDDILPHAEQIPQQFVLDVVKMLNKGSIHSAGTRNNAYGAEPKLREQFAKTCFETLLRFSFLNGLNEPIVQTVTHFADESALNNNTTQRTMGAGNIGALASSDVGHLAISTLLQRFEEVLLKFSEDEEQSKATLPMYRLSEISFVMKAIATLIVSMKKTPPAKLETFAWEKLIGLYPLLINCTTTTSLEVSRALREALAEYQELLRPPATSKHIETNGIDRN